MKNQRLVPLVLPSLVLFFIAMAQGVVPAIAQDAGEEVSNTATAELVEDPDADDQVGRVPSPAEREALEREAGEILAGQPSGRAVVMGMHLQELAPRRAIVVEVAAASPAFDAGIREGDEILSFDGFRGDSYRDWIQGMQRLVTDAPGGDALPVAVGRDGKTLQLRIRVPVQPNVVQRRGPQPLNQRAAPGVPGAPGALGPGQGPISTGGGGDDTMLLSNTFGSAFGAGVGGRLPEMAIAEIYSLNAPPQQPPTDAAGLAEQNAAVRGRQRAGAGGAAAPGGQIGLAGFRNDASGLVVMVEVNGLPPGNYLVGIDDPGVLQGPAATGVPGRNNRPPAQETVPPTSITPPTEGGDSRPPNVPFNSRNRSEDAAAGQGGAAPAGGQNRNQPAGDVDGANSPQGRNELPNRRGFTVPKTVLAQVVDQSQQVQQGNEDGQPAGAAPTAVPPTGTRQPLDTPATGQVNSPGATPTGLPQVDPRQNPALGPDGQNFAGGAGPTIPIGQLTVDQSGIGRLRQVVEGVAVRDVVGQAIAIYAQNGPANAALQPQPGAATNAAAGPANRRRTAAAGAAPQGGVVRPQGAAGSVEPNVVPPGEVPSNVVAGGLIRLASAPAGVPPQSGAEAAPGQGTTLQPGATAPTPEITR